uniref:TRAP transporter small permease n=1 Tax=Desulfatirhabdium butyrativorans TaxID=340467 RepID=A0A7C4VZE7_9BACT
MKTWIRWIDRVSGWSAALCGFILCFSLALILTEIVLRSAFSKTLFITDEYSGYLMSALTFMGLSYTMREKGHIRVTLLQNVLSNTGRLYLDLVCCLVGFLTFAFISWHCALFFWDSVITQSRSMQISETYLAVPQCFMPLGSALLAAQLLSEGLKCIIVLREGQGAVTLRQEAKDLGR